MYSVEIKVSHPSDPPTSTNSVASITNGKADQPVELKSGLFDEIQAYADGAGNRPGASEGGSGDQTSTQAG